jgi:polyphosphate kinase
MSKRKLINRDISWLAFNDRVLQEAEDINVPLIERIRFLGIFSNNLDEFFRVRYAHVKRLNFVKSQRVREELEGLDPSKLLKDLNKIVKAQQSAAQKIYDTLILELEQHDVKLVDEKSITTSQKEYIREYFKTKVSPSVFNLILDQVTEFPQLRDKSIYLAVRIQRKNENTYALIELPSEAIGRFIELPKYGKRYLMYLDDLIRYNLDYIFFIFDYDNIEAHTIKITRDAELDIDNDVSKSSIEIISKGLKNRKQGDPVRFVYDREIPKDIFEYLLSKMSIDNYDSLIAGGRYHNKKDLMNFPNIGSTNLEFDKLEPINHPDLDMNRSIINVIREKDILLFLPYHTFSYIIRFLREAAIDPDVRSIKITLYRLAKDSRIISALINAAKNGKKVTVVIELQARFDERANIGWTNLLRNEGVQVISGVHGLKVHSKVCLVSRLENKSLRHYAVIGTGNYNENTSKFYTDYHLLTSSKSITSDVVNLFEFFNANYQVFNYKHLIVSPHYTREKFLKLIDTEIENAKKGLPASIFLKMNSLSDTVMINKLYEAGSYGVKIRMVVRGICSLIPGEIGLSENIEARSVIDRFLEHSRVYVFENAGQPKFFLSSADWMTRNLDYRVEVTVPVYDRQVQRELKSHIDIIWKDNVKARIHGRGLENAYHKTPGPKVRSQYELYEFVKKQLKNKKLLKRN